MSAIDLSGASDELKLVLTSALGDRANDRDAIVEYAVQQVSFGGALLKAIAPELLADSGRLLYAMAPKVVYAIPGYEYLAEQLVALSGGKLELGKEERKRHKDGKGWQRFLTNVTRRHVIIVGATMTDTDQMEMYKLGCNAKMCKARRLTFVITYHGDARQERAQLSGESVDGLHTSLQIAKVPQCPDGNEVLLVDIHDNTIVGFYQGAEVGCRNIDILPKLIDYVGTNYFGGKKCLAASPDAGRGKLVWKAAKILKFDFAIASKFRSATSGATETAGLIGNVRGRNVMTCDDIGNSLGSATGVGALLKKKRAKRSVLVVTHAAIPEAKYVQDFFDTGLFEALFITDSLKGANELAAQFPGRVHVIPLAPLLVSDILG
jgi:ribose-phosphate pyrophosphokinase